MKSDLNWLLSSIRTTNLSLFLFISVSEYFYFLLDGMFLLLRLQNLIYSKMSNAFIFLFFFQVFKCNNLRKTVKKKKIKSDQHNVCVSIRIKTS